MIKKVLYVFVTTLFVAAMLAACGAPATTVAPVATNPPATSAPATSAPATSVPATSIPQTHPQSDAIVTVTAASQSGTTFVRNFNPYSASQLFPTSFGIYEPLMINNKLTGKITPWLATDYKWSDDLKTLTFTIRDGVKWSDGQAFTATDVVYTFMTLKSTPGLQGFGLAAVSASGYVDSVTAPDAQHAVFAFNRIYTPGLYDIIAQPIVPEHVFKTAPDLVKFTNDTPVGTGPFTTLVSFENQAYEFDRNPNYWQPGKPYIKGLRDVTFSGNDTAAAMFVNGDVQWTGQFFPNVDTAVIAKNPTDLHCWWPTVTSEALFMMNTTKKPFDDVVVRKAISMSFNRTQLIQVALQGKSSPADVTGLSSGYAAFKVADPTTLGTWTNYDAAKANADLDAAGYKKGADGFRTNKDGSPISVELLMVNGFTDWLAEAPLLKQMLGAIGLNVTINSYDVPIAFGKWMKGDFDMSLYFGITADTPYTYYRNIMSSDTVLPVGTDTGLGVNMWRYSNKDADAALKTFASSADLAVQKQAALDLQKIFADNAPVIPMYYAPTFYCYSDKTVTGWPTANNPYAYPMPIATANADPGQLLVLTTIYGK